MFDLREYREKPDRLQDLLPWAAIIGPGLILNKNGSFQKTYFFRGPDLESSTRQELMIVTARLNNVLKRMGTGWSLFIEARRRPSMHYPRSTFPGRASQLMDDERCALFSRAEMHFESDYYITFNYLPPEEKYMQAQSRFIEKSDVDLGKQGYAQFLEQFEQNVSRVVDILYGIMPVIYPLNDDETLTYLHSTISSKIQPVRRPEIPMYLDSVLCDMPLRAGLEPKIGNCHLRTITVMSFPGISWPGIMDGLNKLPLEYRWVTRFIALDKNDGIKEVNKYKRKWFAKRKGIVTMLKEMISGSQSVMTDNDAVNKAHDADAAYQEISDDLVSFGYYTSTVTVWSEEANSAEEKIKEVERIINGLGFVTQNEKTNAIQAWLGSLPGHCYANVRRPILSSLNLSHLIPMSAVWAGPEKNKHLKGPPLLQAQTAGNTPFRLVNHVGDVGHTMILGPTGAGKSVLLVTLAMQFLRYENAQVYIFDKGCSAFAATIAVGGDHYNIAKKDSGLAFQPLGGIDDEAERTWASEWVLTLLDQEKVEIIPSVKSEVWAALSSLATAPKAQRTLTGLSALIQNLELREALMPYTISGAHGALLDADQDTLDYGKWQCFEMEELMNLPSVVPPVLDYIFHRLEARFKGSPTLLILDEAWLFLDNPIFSAKIREWLKVLRKSNVSVIFATQSVADAANSSIAPALMESCLTRIFLPNANALNAETREFYTRFGLNERQVQILAGATPKLQYYFQSQEGTRLFELGLGRVTLAFCAASSKEDQALVRHLLNEKGKEGFLDAFIEAKGLGPEIERINQELTELEILQKDKDRVEAEAAKRVKESTASEKAEA